MEGFPRTQQEATFMTDTGLFPDGCIILEVEDENVGDRQVGIVKKLKLKHIFRKICSSEKLLSYTDLDFQLIGEF